jgi:hypothetical protein
VLYAFRFRKDLVGANVSDGTCVQCAKAAAGPQPVKSIRDSASLPVKRSQERVAMFRTEFASKV